MGDIIYCGAIMGVLVVFSVWYAIIGGDSEHRVFSAGDYGIKVKAVRCWKFFFYLVFVVLSFILSFMDIKFNITKLVALVYNVVSLMIFFNDAFIKNIKKDQYILILQHHTEKEVNFSDMFHVRENKANYVLDGTDETMLFKICDAENGKAICRKNKNGSTLLIPNKNMELDELNFMCKQVNIYWTYHKELPKTVKCFEDKSVYKCIDEYVWELFPRIDFLFLPQTKSKINKIVKVLVILLVSTLLTLLFLDEFFNCSIFADISNWLFE